MTSTKNPKTAGLSQNISWGSKFSTQISNWHFLTGASIGHRKNKYASP